MLKQRRGAILKFCDEALSSDNMMILNLTDSYETSITLGLELIIMFFIMLDNQILSLCVAPSSATDLCGNTILISFTRIPLILSTICVITCCIGLKDQIYISFLFISSKNMRELQNSMISVSMLSFSLLFLGKCSSKKIVFRVIRVVCIFGRIQTCDRAAVSVLKVAFIYFMRGYNHALNRFNIV